MTGNIRNDITTESASLPVADHKEWIEVTKSDKDSTIKLITDKEKSSVFKDIRYFKLKEGSTFYAKFEKSGNSELIAWGAGETLKDAIMKCKDGLTKFINNN